MKKVWVINHYATPPEKGTFVRQYYFAKNLKDKYSFEIFTASKIHNSNENVVEKGKKVVTKEFGNIPFHFIRTCDYGSNGFKRILNMLQFAFRILFLSDEKYGRPNIVYASSPDLISTFFSVFLAKMYRSSLITEVRDIWPWSISEYSNRFSINHIVIRALSLVEKWIYKQSDAVIFTMEGGKEYISDRNWEKIVPHEKIYHINNGVSIKDFEVADEDVKQKSSNELNLVYSGSLRTANDIVSLVESMKLLPSNIKLKIYGSGGDHHKISKMIEYYKIENVKLMGRVDKSEIPQILSKSDATVLHYKRKDKSLLNKYGSSQNKLFEYMAAKKPVLSNQKFGYDIINKNNCGVAADCKTPDDFARLILEFSKMTNEEYQIKCDNCEHTAKLYDWSHLAEKLDSVISEIAGGRR